jgi:hypothetical protein
MDFRKPQEIWQDPKQNVIDFGRIFCIGLFVIGTVIQASHMGWIVSWSNATKYAAVSYPWWLIGCLMITLASIAPSLIRPLYVLWMLLGQCMGFIVHNIILMSIYYLIFTPVGLLYRRWCNIITKKTQADLSTYWTTKTTGKNNKSYYRQY